MNLYLSAPYSNWMKNGMDIYLAGPSSGNMSPLWRKHSGTNKAMEIFLAGTNSDLKRAGSAGDFAQRISVLESFFYVKEWMDPYIRDHWQFMLDSGAFTFMQNPKGSIDWETYVDRYADYINARGINLFFELDIDAVVGIERVEALRRRLEQRTGKQPIPVWHHGRGRAYWGAMCKEYPYVALGGMVSDVAYRKRLEPMFPYFINSAREAGAKIHGLGYTSIAGLHRYKFDSVDSTSWLHGNKGGVLYRFNGRGIDKIAAPEGKGLKSMEGAVNNFREWVKFQHYAREHL